jgi:hypothetical protein
MGVTRGFFIVNYGGHSRIFSLRKEQGLKVFENRELDGRGPRQRGSITRELRNFHKEEVYNLHSSCTSLARLNQEE